MKNSFLINKHTKILLDSSILSDTLTNLWHGFSFGITRPEFSCGEEGRVSIGKACFIPLDDGDEYTICIKEEGIGICGRDSKGLIRGFMMLMMCIEQVQADKCAIECRDIHGKFNVSNRMIHLCVFPETSFETIRRQVRLCGVLQYTHIILEFWGMLKYDCLKELSWPCGFEKERAAEIIREARDMGMEPIPMFNHLGHASGCRIANGKHTVLDQNLSLHHLFTPDGWAWNIHSEDTKQLLREVRKELYDLFGEGEYVHLGCDEAYIFSNGYIDKSELRDYLGEITAEAVSEGRKPIIWGDMLVGDKEAGCVGEKYYCAKIETDEAEEIRAKLAPETIIGDWQYDITEGQIKTSVILKKKGYKVIICPWFDTKNIEACINTAHENELFGVMETAWHTLSSEMPSLVVTAKKFGLPETSWSAFAEIRTYTATLLRKVAEENRDYKECGFTATQIAERNQ